MCSFPQISHFRILPALLVGSGLKRCSAGIVDRLAVSPGFIGREWIETMEVIISKKATQFSPGFIGREWIETPKIYHDN